MKAQILFLWILFIMGSLIQTEAYAQEECVLIIQGVRDNPKEDFFNNSSDAMARAMGSFQPTPKITVLRPKGEKSNLGATPERAEKNYEKKSELLKQIEEAICDAKCKNVVISFVGHGMGGTSIDNPPENDKAGGMKVGPKNIVANDYLTAGEMAAIIDRCKKSVKLIPAQCYAASMINGILDQLKNKHLVGVAVGSSDWDKKSWGEFGGLYDFIKYFLEDYYLIINDPNVMEQIRKNAEELKKKNEENNKKIEEANKEIEQKLVDCEKEFKELATRRKALEEQTKEQTIKRDNAKEAIKLLKERIALEESLETEKDKKKIKELKESLKTNAEVLKKLGVTGLPSGGKIDKLVEKLNKEIDKQKEIADTAQEALDRISEEWEIVNPVYVAKQAMIEDLKEKIKAPIPNHLPVMELVIHEAFKSAKANTKTSTPVEPVVPEPAGIVELPKNPLTHVNVKDENFYFRKVTDKKTNKCTVVGYRADKNGNPIGPITSKNCDISCKNLEFSYHDGKQNHDVKANLNESTQKYYIYLDNQKVSLFKPGYRKAELILPGSLLAEVHFQTLFNKINDVVVPGWVVNEMNYSEACHCLNFTINTSHKIHQIAMHFLEHEDIQIQIDHHFTYLWSETRNYSLLQFMGIQTGKLGLIMRDGHIIGSMMNCNQNSPIPMHGQIEEDGERFLLQTSQGSYLFMVYPNPENSSLINWQSSEYMGLLYHDLKQEPIIKQFTVLPNTSGFHHAHWELFLDHLSQGDLAKFKHLLMVVEQENGMVETYQIPTNQNAWVDPVPRLETSVQYKLYAVCEDEFYSVAYHGPYFYATGLQECISLNGNISLRNNNSDVKNDENHAFCVAIPNPFAVNCTIHIISNKENSGNLAIYGLNGSFIWKSEFKLQEGLNRLEIPESVFEISGMYFYQWFDGIQTKVGKIQKL